MKRFLLAALGAGLSLTSIPASATTLTFTNACGGPCADWSPISQDYGDIAGVLDISYRSVAGQGSKADAGSAYYWGANFGDLDGVLFGADGAALEIAFHLLDPTKTITFQSVDYAGWFGSAPNTQMALYTPSNAADPYLLPLWPSGALTAPASGHATWAPSRNASGWLIFHFGPDGYNAAIDNLTFDIKDANVIDAVPEPATWLSMILGFGLTGAAMRRRKVSAAFANPA
jgi:PEP-CTERM motif